MGSAIERDPSKPALCRIETDVLIVGAGPAGGSLACFLTTYGINGLVIGQDGSTAYTPRAHYVNMAAFECFRDLGIEAESREQAAPVEQLKWYRIVSSLAGEEYCRQYSYGSSPYLQHEYHDASPCDPANLPQSRMEPILVRYASQHGFKVRLDTKFISFTQNTTKGRVESIVEDLVTKERILIISKYLCGADGGRSRVAEQLQLPYNESAGGGLAMSAFIQADLTRLMDHCQGLLSLTLCPDKPQPSWCALGIVQMAKPWNEWVFMFLAKPDTTQIVASDEEILRKVRDMIGDDSIDVQIKRRSIWRMNECYAERYSRGPVFCLGDAVHRHPPFNGLGSNTCVQDAYNLAWKLAYVLRGQAGAALLDTYNAERQPVGAYVVKRANDTRRMHLAMSSELGLLGGSGACRQALDELSEDSVRGARRRAGLQKAFEDLDVERHCIGGEMNQLYESTAVFADDETEQPERPADAHEHTFHYLQSTYPGSRLPHAWLRTPTAHGPGLRQPMISTQDLAGKSRFTLFTGIGGKKEWGRAAAQASQELGVEIAVFSIGYGQDYEDALYMWVKKRGVGDNGAVLVRPDRTVAWRCKVLDPVTYSAKLALVMRRILGLE